MVTTQPHTANRLLMAALVLAALDLALKLWVFYNLQPAGHDYSGIIGLTRVHTLSFRAYSFYTRLAWLAFFLFIFIRARRTQAPVLIQAGATLAFVGIAGNFVDTFLFPLLDAGIGSIMLFRYINTFYINLGFWIAIENIASLMASAGILLLAAGALASFGAFKKLFRRQSL